MNITDTGTLICNATNILGNYIKHFTILVTGMFNMFCIFDIVVILSVYFRVIEY